MKRRSRKVLQSVPKVYVNVVDERGTHSITGRIAVQEGGGLSTILSIFAATGLGDATDMSLTIHPPHTTLAFTFDRGKIPPKSQF